MATVLRIETVPSWDDTAAMNAHLRRIWTKVPLDDVMEPTAYWRDARFRYDESMASAQIAEELEDVNRGGMRREPGALRAMGGPAWS